MTKTPNLSSQSASSTEAMVRDIRCKTRKYYNAEENIRIVFWRASRRNIYYRAMPL